MSEKPVYLTRDGRDALEAELLDLTTNGRKAVQERIAQARDLGDISESGEYEDAKNQQAFMEGRILEIKHILSKAQIIEEEGGDNHQVHVGSSVTVRYEDGEEETYTIVGSTEASPSDGRISNESPVGNALLGKKPRQKVTVNTPQGMIKLTVVRIR